MKKQINDLLLKMQTGENCIGETANKLLDLYGVVLSNRYKTEEFSIYTPKDDECVVVIEDSFKHKRTFDINDFNKLMSVLHSVQDY